jgi:hypothetical protein
MHPRSGRLQTERDERLLARLRELGRRWDPVTEEVTAVARSALSGAGPKSDSQI